MRVRHRIPSIFSLSMVDVMCCALGCVILLWLLNLRQAKEEEDKAAVLREKATKDDETARQEIAEKKAAIARLEKQADALKTEIRDDKARLETTRATADKRLAELEAARKALEETATSLRNQLATAEKWAANSERTRTRAIADLTNQLSGADAMLLDLAGQLQAVAGRNKELKADANLVPGLQAQLLATERKMAELEKERDAKLAEKVLALDKLKATSDQALKLQREELALARSFETRWKAAEERLTGLNKELASSKEALAAANGNVGALRAGKETLETEIFRIRQAADNRFAGITLTGRNVVFLVDMSGSMELVDEKTEAPEKWSGVRNTLVKIMNSLPDLKKFQIILFEEKTAFLLGNPDEWIDYNRQTSAARVEAALKAVKPKGGTNMYAALQAAFRFRPRGLDTIYLFSDGLPNIGDGVPDAEARRMLETGREPELSGRLAQHIRKTLKTAWNRDTGTDRVRINAVGFFYESPDVGAFLWALARENEGSFVGMSKP